MDLRYFASEIGASGEPALRELVANLLEKGIVSSRVRNTPMVRHGEVITHNFFEFSYPWAI